MTLKFSGPTGQIFDIFIIGGGINGCGIARDAAGRGYSVCLAEMYDLASGTSSASTKLIHGGLRYLEHFEFRLVREALVEREIIWTMAPHIIKPMRFVLPHHKGLRSKWLLRLGLFLYDNLGGRKHLPGSRTLNLRSDPLGRALRPEYGPAFEYSDCWVDDARLVVLNAQDAAEHGATIRTRTKVAGAKREGDLWLVEVEDAITGETEVVRARMLINAAGPWIGSALKDAEQADIHAVRLVKGSHIVVPKIYEDERSFFFQNSDGRIFFAIPYEDDFTLIGTTDEEYAGNPAQAEISEGETQYLIEAANAYFADTITSDDIVWTYSGVRPLYDDGASKAQEATRDYVLKLTGKQSEAKLLTIIGGKITTYRRLAESALEHVERTLGAKSGRWTAGSHLPGGRFAVGSFQSERDRLIADYPFLKGAQADRLMRLYGLNARIMLGSAKSLSDLGYHFGAGLYAAEIDYLVSHEWARTADDVLWRRTKRGLRAGAIDTEELKRYIAGRIGIE